MLPFQEFISKNYKWEQYRLLNQETRNITCYSGNICDFGGPITYPLCTLNPDKKLHIFGHKEYRISETEATVDRIKSMCRENREIEENTYTLTVICFTKGLTFINNYLSKNSEYDYLDRISLYLQQGPAHKIRAYKNGRRIVITTNQTSTAIESAIFSALPLLLQKEFKWDEKTILFFQLAGQNNPESLKEMKKLFDDFTKHLLENAKKKELENVLINAANHQKENIAKELTVIQRRIKEYETALVDLLKKEKESQALVTFFKPDLNIEEVSEYVINNKYIIDYYNNGTRYFIVAVEAPLEYVDVTALKKMLSNITSYLYPKTNGAHMPESVANHETEFIRLLKDLFITGKYRVYTRSEVVIDFEKKAAYPLRFSGNYSSSALAGTRPVNWRLYTRFQENPDRCVTPHMHIEYYDCWSGNKTNIAKALNKNDIIGALDIIVNTTKDINVNDGAVFGRFIREALYNPREFRTQGYTTEPDPMNYLMPGNQFKTIWDTEKECFRTFDDIFQNDYLKDKLQNIEIEGE